MTKISASCATDPDEYRILNVLLKIIHKTDFLHTCSFSAILSSYRISDAFQRHALLDASKLSVEIVGTKAILRGNARSYAEKEDAELAAYSAPGIFEIDNRITIETPEYSYEE